MKKNIKFIGAAAAALLAVAPVVASTTVANAATISFETSPNYTPAFTISSNKDIMVDFNVSAVGMYLKGEGNDKVVLAGSSVSTNATATYNGASYSLNIPEGHPNYIYDATTNQSVPANQLVAGNKYYAVLNDVSINFGSQNANKKNITVGSSNGSVFKLNTNDGYLPSVKVSTDQNGVAQIASIRTADFTAIDPTNARTISFYNKDTGNQVTTGDVTVYAGAEGKVNVETVLDKYTDKYQAAQLNNVHGSENKKLAITDTTAKDIASQLRAQGITVDDNGYFVAPKSFTVNIKAKSAINNATATLPLTVKVPNSTVADTTTPAEVTKSATIMHKAYFYEKDGKTRTTVNGDSAIGAYNEIQVVETPVVINGKNFYKVAGHDAYINAGNIDGTSRKLTHNAYIYNNKGKRVQKKTVLKKGSYKTTYGASFNIHGKRYYRIGMNQYVKVANF